MSKFRTFSIYILIFAAFMFSFMFEEIVVDFKGIKVKILESYVRKLENYYKITTEVYSKLADFIYQSHINKPEIKQLFAQGVFSNDPNEKERYRKELYQKLSELYNLMLKYNFRYFQFHEYNNKNFLRFHRLELFGDDLTGVRYTVEYVNREKKPVSGFELGCLFEGYRFVYPISINGQYVGSVELGISMRAIIEEIEKFFNQKTQFIILKSALEDEKCDEEISKNYSTWFVDEKFLIDNTLLEHDIPSNEITEEEILKIKNMLAENHGNSKPFWIKVSINSKPYIMTFLPINNFEGEKVAYIYTLFDGKDIMYYQKNFYYTFFLLLILFGLTVFFIFYYRISHDKIERLATYDSLTKVYNRNIIMILIKNEFERYKRYKKPFSVIMMDIDNFKNINDTYGHQTGDWVLSEFAKIMKNSIRKSDSVGRYGGDEFIVLLSDTKLDDAVIVAEKIKSKVSEFVFPKVRKVTISMGVSEISSKMKSIDDLIKEADMKLYKAKENGRDRIEY